MVMGQKKHDPKILTPTVLLMMSWSLWLNFIALDALPYYY